MANSPSRAKKAWGMRCENRGVTGGWKVNYGAVFGDNGVDKVQIASDATQLVQDSAGHQDHSDLAPPRIPYSSKHRWMWMVVARERAVVVEREN